jgi:hypothetical protein
MTDEQDADPSSQQPLNIARRGHISTKEIEPIDSSSSASIPGFFSRRPLYTTHSRINRNARHFKKICSCWQKMDGEIAPTNAVAVWKIQKK